MPAPDNPLVAKVAMLFARDTRTFVNTFHVANDVALTASDLINIAGLFASWWNTAYSEYSSNDVALKQIQVRKLDPSDPLAYDQDIGPVSPGQQASEADTGATTQTISWRTGFAGRKYRGRIFAVGLPEGFVNTDDSITSPQTTFLASAASQLLSDLLAAGFKLVVFHKSDNTFTQVLTAIVENLVDAQRRRLASRGR